MMEEKNLEKEKCVFSTDITDQITCCKDGEFDYYGFPINICAEYPCNKIKEIREDVDKLRIDRHKKVGEANG
jgi:hypothetical protein